MEGSCVLFTGESESAYGRTKVNTETKLGHVFHRGSNHVPLEFK